MSTFWGDIAEFVGFKNKHSAAGEQRRAAKQAMEFEASQAREQMAFQENMSNTAHQREVADLKAAGLNPILSTTHSGASTPSGAMGGSSMPAKDDDKFLKAMSMVTEIVTSAMKNKGRK